MSGALVSEPQQRALDYLDKHGDVENVNALAKACGISYGTAAKAREAWRARQVEPAGDGGEEPPPQNGNGKGLRAKVAELEEENARWAAQDDERLELIAELAAENLRLSRVLRAKEE